MIQVPFFLLLFGYIKGAPKAKRATGYYSGLEPEEGEGHSSSVEDYAANLRLRIGSRELHQTFEIRLRC